MRNKMSLLIYVVMGLAVVGLFSQLFKNTVAFIQSIVITIIIAAVMIAVIRYFLRKRSGIPASSSDDMKKYKQAVKQSKLKYSKKHKQQPTTNRGRTTIQALKRRQRPSHLRVIDGGNKTSNNKSKRNNRATY